MLDGTEDALYTCEDNRILYSNVLLIKIRCQYTCHRPQIIIMSGAASVSIKILLASILLVFVGFHGSYIVAVYWITNRYITFCRSRRC